MVLCVKCETPGSAEPDPEVARGKQRSALVPERYLASIGNTDTSKGEREREREGGSGEYREGGEEKGREMIADR